MKAILLIILFITSYSGLASSSLLQKDLERIRNEFSLPSLSGAYLSSGKLLEVATAGIRKSGFETKTTVNDKHHLGSCGKSMTATLAAVLVEKGYFKWNSTLEELLPKIELNDEFKDVTFELLLSHRSGLKNNTEGWLNRILVSELYSPTQSRKLVTETLLALPPRYSPGEKFNYSNIGYMIAGYIMEYTTSISWETLMRMYVFNPLQMHSCNFGPTSTLGNSLPVQPWGHDVVGGLLKPVHADNAPAFSPAGTIHCSLGDWGKYLNEHIEGFNGRSNYLENKSFNKLHSVYPEENSTYTYGGWFRLERNWAKGTVLTHTGTNTLNFSNVWLAPMLKSGFISTTNIKRNGHTATNKAITSILKRRVLNSK